MMLETGKPLPREMRDGILNALAAGSSGLIIAPMKLFIVALRDLRPADLVNFRGPATMGLAREKSFMLINLDFNAIQFDLIWVAALARASEEPPLPDLSEGERDIFTFVLADDKGVAMAIRSASVAPEMGRALRRAQQEIIMQDDPLEVVNRDLAEFFSAFPDVTPQDRFHEISRLGE